MNAIAIDAPLCRCCEEALATEGHTDEDLGPVCPPCEKLLTFAAFTLEMKVEGYSKCEPLGPDSGKGVLS